MPRLLVILCGWIATLSAGAAEAPALPTDSYARVEIAPAETRVLYVARVTLTVDPLERVPGGYQGTYRARVSPFTFLSETGVLHLAAGEEQLRRLGQGEAVAFTGEAIDDRNRRHRLEGTAQLESGQTGSFDVSIFHGDVDVTFATRFSFAAPDGSPSGEARPRHSARGESDSEPHGAGQRTSLMEASFP